VNTPVIKNITLSAVGNQITVKGSGFELEFDKSKGTFSKIVSKGNSLLANNGGPMLHLWRAPHRNDDMWANEGWEKNGIKALTWTAANVTARQIDANKVEIKADLTGTGKNNFNIKHQVIYKVFGDGDILADNVVVFSDPGITLGRIGVRMFLNKELDNFSFFGRGPMENYSDRKSGFPVGKYTGTVNSQLTPYEKPMEGGNHEDVKWAGLTSARGAYLGIRKDETLLQVSAVSYSDEEMEGGPHRKDLPESKRYRTLHQSQNVGGWLQLMWAYTA
jgi:beta-galactosidase